MIIVRINLNAIADKQLEVSHHQGMADIEADRTQGITYNCHGQTVF